MKPLYEAVVTSMGGRASGHVKSKDGVLDLEMNLPKEMGGNGGKANPEILFAGAYSACFEGAMYLVAQKMNKKITKSKVEAHVTVGNDDEGGFELQTKLRIHLPEFNKADGTQIMNEAHKVCPYSKATRGNMKVDLEFAED